MKITELITQNDSGVSFEFFPPKTEAGLEPFVNTVKELKTLDPLYVSVTYGAGGTTQDRTRNAIYKIIEETGLTVMSHLTCIGADRESMDSLLDDYSTNGVSNILALRGDPPKDAPGFDPLKGDFKYARDLVSFVREKKSFSISVAVYPEGHQEAPSIEADMDYTKQKIDAGADFAITQMFFDNSYFYGFMERAEKAGISIPVLPGIIPITDFKKISTFAEFCAATIPDGVKKKFEPVLDNPDEMYKLGIELAVKQCRDLRDNGVKYFHFYTLNRSDAAADIIKGLFS